MSALPPPGPDDRTVIRTPKLAPTNNNGLPPGTKLLDEFEIILPVGEGGFGIVYLAYDHTLRRNVAIKEYMPSALAWRRGDLTVGVKSEHHADTFDAGLKSFVNEARLLAQFDHPSLLKVYRFWEANGTAYMVMPYYEGVTLKDALQKLGTRPDEQWLKRMLAPLLDALECLHREHCFHRDISPENILVLNDGRLLLLDFGAARRVIGDMTQSLTVVLRPGYAPVEQYDEMPEMKQGPWTDIYALASVLYFAILGKPPVSSVTRLVSDPSQPLRVVAAGQYSDRFLSGIDKALAVLPNDRPQSISELRAALDVGAADALASSGAMGRRFVIRSYFAVGAAALVAAAAIGFMLWQKEESAPARTTSPPPDSAVPGPVPATATVLGPGELLDQVYDGRNRTHIVEAWAEPRVARIGRDRLRFALRSSKPGFVYVLVLGTNETDFVLLFPNAADQSNRIEPGETWTLPRETWPLKALGPAGTNRFVVVVSDAPRDFGHLGARPDDIFLKFPSDAGVRLPDVSQAGGPVYAGRSKCEPTAECSTAYGAAQLTIDEVPGG